MDRYDVVIVGTGTAGQTAAAALLDHGKRVAIVDHGPVGGTCALRGCQAKKFFVVNTQLVATTRALVGKGVASPATTDWAGLQTFKRGFTDPIPEKTTTSLSERGIDVFVEHAEFSSVGSLILQESGREIVGTSTILATGAHPRPLSIPGSELARTSTDFLSLEQLPESMVFIGGGYISMELAFAAALSGTKVTILQRGPRMLPQFPDTIVTPVVEEGTRLGIHFVTDADVTAIEKNSDGVFAVHARELGKVSASWVMAAIGRAPNVEDLGLDALGLTYSDRGVEVNEFMETSIEGVFAAGDCVASKQLAPLSDMEAQVAAANIVTARSRSVDYRSVPSVVFTDPQMASVGLTPDQARSDGYDIRVNSGRGDQWASYRRLGNPVVFYETVTDKSTDQLLGASIASPHAGELINLFTVAIRTGMTASAMKETPWAYPTYLSDVKYMV